MRATLAQDVVLQVDQVPNQPEARSCSVRRLQLSKTFLGHSFASHTRGGKCTASVERASCVGPLASGAVRTMCLFPPVPQSPRLM